MATPLISNELCYMLPPLYISMFGNCDYKLFENIGRKNSYTEHWSVGRNAFANVSRRRPNMEWTFCTLHLVYMFVS